MRFLFSSLRAISGLGAVVLAASCAGPAPQPPMPPPLPLRTEEPKAWWRGDGVAGAPRLVIDLSKQRVFYYKGERLVGVSPISSGREGNDTRVGNFRVMEKDLDHRSSLYGDFVDAAGNVVRSDVDSRVDQPLPGTRFRGANMRYFMRITGAIGMHEGYLPGYPASHGCIRLPTEMAAKFFYATPLGTPVKVVGHASQAAYEPPEPRPAVVVAAPVPELSKNQKKQLKSSSSRAFASKKRKARRAPPGTTLYLEE